jgi:predicted AlkP superfamily pyrophosphatase or phosphodiesterase
MRKGLVLVVLLAFCLAFRIGASADEIPKNLIIIGWDGAGLNNVEPMIRKGRLPTLSSLLERPEFGIYPLQNLGMTCTVPNWTMLFTGLTADQTGILGNVHLTDSYVEQFWANRTQRDAVFHLPVSFNFWIGSLPTRYYFPALLRSERGMKVGWVISKSFLSDNPGLAHSVIL